MSDSAANKVRFEVTARLDTQLHERLREAAFKTNRSHQAIMVEALAEKLQSGVKPAAPSRDARWHEMLDVVLQSGDRSQIQIIQQQLQICRDQVARSSQPEQKKKAG